MFRIHVLMQKGNFMKHLLIVLSLYFNITSLMGMELIDAKGDRIVLNNDQADEFLSSELAANYIADPLLSSGLVIDFSGRNRAGFQGDLLKKLLNYSRRPELLICQPVCLEEGELLDAAEQLGLNATLLYHLANRIWPYTQSDSQTLQEEATKRKWAALAKPYLHSPRHILAALHRENSGITVESLCKQMNGGYYFDFARKETLPYVLGSLDGLQECLDYVAVRAYSKVAGGVEGNGHLTPYDIDLSYNELTECDIDSLENRSILRYQYRPHFRTIVLAHNNIRKITASRKDYVPERNQHIDLTGNPVSFIDDSVYQLAKLYRSQGNRLHINMPHNRLNPMEQALAQQQWYLAANTLVDRYFGNHNPDLIGNFSGLFIVLMSGVAGAYTQNQMLLCPGLAGGLFTCFALNCRYLPTCAYSLAIKTHSEIKKPTFSCDRPFGILWLPDSEKPHLILS